MKITIFKYAVYLIIRFLNALFIKKRVYLGDSERYVTQGGCIIASWHQNIAFMEGVKFNKAGALLSKSKDGDLMLKIFKHKGWRAFRLKLRGGVKAMEEVINHFNNVENDMTFVNSKPSLQSKERNFSNCQRDWKTNYTGNSLRKKV